jgi:hypothetical protein
MFTNAPAAAGFDDVARGLSSTAASDIAAAARPGPLGIQTFNVAIQR